MPRAFQFAGITFTKTGLLTLFTPSFLASNLIAWWAADQTLTVNGSNQVTAWTDLSGNGNTLSNATPASSLVETTNVQNALPMVANSAGLTSGIEWVQTTAAVTAAAFQSSTPFTLSFVMKRLPPVSAANFPTIIGNNITSSVAGWFVSTATSITGGVLNSVYFRMTGSGLLASCGSTPLVSGVPYIVVITYDGLNTTSSLQFYINGVAETMTNITATLTSATVTNGPLTIGGATTNFRNADSIGEVAIFNSKLTTAQIASLSQYMDQRWNVY